MVSILDKSLDEIIKEKALSSRRDDPGRGRGVGARDYLPNGTSREDRFGPVGPMRNRPFLDVPRPAPYSAPRTSNYDSQRQDRYIAPNRTRSYPTGVSSSVVQSKVRVEGLDPNWESRDVMEIFAEQGYNVRDVSMQWDRAGRSIGKCVMLFRTEKEATTCIKDMDGAEVDGFPLTLRLMSSQPPFADRDRDLDRNRDRDLDRNRDRDLDRNDPIRSYSSSGRPPLRPYQRDNGWDNSFRGPRQNEWDNRDRDTFRAPPRQQNGWEHDYRGPPRPMNGGPAPWRGNDDRRGAGGWNAGRGRGGRGGRDSGRAKTKEQLDAELEVLAKMKYDSLPK